MSEAESPVPEAERPRGTRRARQPAERLDAGADLGRLRRAVESLERTYAALSSTTRTLVQINAGRRSAAAGSWPAGWTVPWSIGRVALPLRDADVRETSNTLVSLGEAAAITGRHPELLRRWCAAGRLRGELVGGSWFVRLSDLDTIDAMPRRGRRSHS